MKKITFIRESKYFGTGISNITIDITDMKPKEAAKFLVKELNKWNEQALSTITSITIE